MEKFEIGSPALGYYKKETEGNITKFATIGCKNYSYISDANEKVIKCRGFQLSSQISKDLINFETMHNMVTAMVKGVKIEKKAPHFRMALNRKSFDVYNSEILKTYSNQAFNKRWIPNNLDLTEDANVTSYPYGWIKEIN